MDWVHAIGEYLDKDSRASLFDFVTSLYAYRPISGDPKELFSEFTASLYPHSEARPSLLYPAFISSHTIPLR